MNDPEDTRQSTPQPMQQPAAPQPEIHREREIIVTGDGGRSGPGTALLVIFAFVALVVIAVLAFTFLQRDGEGLIPDEIDVNVELPNVGGGS